MGKFEEITVLMAKACNFDSNISDFNSVDHKVAKKSKKAKNIFSGKVIGLSKKAIKAAKRP